MREEHIDKLVDCIKNGKQIQVYLQTSTSQLLRSKADIEKEREKQKKEAEELEKMLESNKIKVEKLMRKAEKMIE